MAKRQASIIVFAGSDESAVSANAREFAAANASADAGEFGKDIVGGEADNADAAMEAIHQTIQSLLTLPFFGGEKLVWLKNASFLADTVTGRSAGVLDALEKLGSTLESGLPDGVRFLLSASPVDKRRSFYKLLCKVGDVRVSDKPDASKGGWEEAVGDWVEELLKTRGYSIEPRALQGLLARCGPETGILESEVEKLSLYLGSERDRVTTEDVRLMVPLTRAGIIWELGNAIAERDLRRALAQLERLLQQGESAVGILLVAVIPTVRNLLIARELMARHRLSTPAQPQFFASSLKRLPEEALRHLPKKKDGGINTFGLGVAAMNAERYTVAELIEALELCLEANLTLVTSQLEVSVVLGTLLTKVIGRRQPTVSKGAARR